MLGKLLGAGLILGCSSYAGWQVAGAYARRPVQLRDLQTALAVLQTEIEYGATPLPEALASAARAGGPAVGAIFRATAERLAAGGGNTPGDAMREALADQSGSTALRPGDLSIVAALAEVLGATGRADQVRHLSLARERLAGEEARAADERARYERMARYLGVLGGAALVLIFI
ncbi:MAG TPA: stage III sporulation protein SpoIIIAB [Symbiobacteriaceae bacterium]|nr:stage III sporulation protein SpoIIIAB [Symbiobacteriaceae bacterium]